MRPRQGSHPLPQRRRPAPGQPSRPDARLRAHAPPRRTSRSTSPRASIPSRAWSSPCRWPWASSAATKSLELELDAKPAARRHPRPPGRQIAAGPGDPVACAASTAQVTAQVRRVMLPRCRCPPSACRTCRERIADAAGRAGMLDRAHAARSRAASTFGRISTELRLSTATVWKWTSGSRPPARPGPTKSWRCWAWATCSTPGPSCERTRPGTARRMTDRRQQRSTPRSPTRTAAGRPDPAQPIESIPTAESLKGIA